MSAKEVASINEKHLIEQNSSAVMKGKRIDTL